MPNDTIILDIGFGDGGKGTIIDYLAEEYPNAVDVKFSGAVQCVHNVVARMGHHKFQQFGAATFHRDVNTYISRHFYLCPMELLVENSYLSDQIAEPKLIHRMVISPNVTIITPFHVMVARMRIAIRNRKYGSCGLGVGETIRDHEKNLSLSILDCIDHNYLLEKLRTIGSLKHEEAKAILAANPDNEAAHKIYEHFRYQYTIHKLADFYKAFLEDMGIHFDLGNNYLMSQIQAGRPLLYEGSQGALLDRHFGFTPHITQAKVTYHQAFELHPLPEKPRKLGVFRAYAHRHGSGPLPTEDIRYDSFYYDHFNLRNDWQGPFRVGPLDLVLLRYGIEANDGVDGLAMTCLDQLSGLLQLPVCNAYEYEGDEDDLVDNFVYSKNGNGTFTITDIQPRTIDRDKVTRVLEKCHPICHYLPGWIDNIRACKDFSDLPKNAQAFVRHVEKLLRTKIELISVNETREGKFTIR